MKPYYSFVEINEALKNDAEGFVRSCEDEYHNKINEGVGKILENNIVDIVMLAGPSSAGKTTTALKIAEGIAKSGKNAYRISLDDFYFNRDDIPINSDGLPDFENITALDLPLIKETFNSLINKREAVLPVFNFNTGEREKDGTYIELKKNDVIIVEGIHALNPIITEGIDASHIYKVYLNASSRVITQNTRRVLLTKRNIRFTRRMIRDFYHRGSSVENTYFLWSGVRKGEDQFIFPYKSNANFFINSFHPYEPCLFKNEAVKLLSAISDDSPYSDEATRLRESISRFDEMDISLLPEDSLLREFIG
ncbi:MAG: nucleoside kinase [Clostridia bacterium]|nr:nucleoside kinase [Clostridia bacterium]